MSASARSSAAYTGAADRDTPESSIGRPIPSGLEAPQGASFAAASGLRVAIFLRAGRLCWAGRGSLREPSGGVTRVDRPCACPALRVRAVRATGRIFLASRPSRLCWLGERLTREPLCMNVRMKILFIGGTGIISSVMRPARHRARFRRVLAGAGEAERTRPCPRKKPKRARVTSATTSLLNVRWEIMRLMPSSTSSLSCPEHAETDIALFRNRTNQYVFISSASAYKKPVVSLSITESTPLRPIHSGSTHATRSFGEQRLLHALYRADGFINGSSFDPSHTYDQNALAVRSARLWRHGARSHRARKARRRPWRRHVALDSSRTTRTSPLAWLGSSVTRLLWARLFTSRATSPCLERGIPGRRARSWKGCRSGARAQRRHRPRTRGVGERVSWATRRTA